MCKLVTGFRTKKVSTFFRTSQIQHFRVCPKYLFIARLLDRSLPKNGSHISRATGQRCGLGHLVAVFGHCNLCFWQKIYATPNDIFVMVCWFCLYVACDGKSRCTAFWHTNNRNSLEHFRNFFGLLHHF